MKFFAIYWIIGCLFVGVGLGAYEARCPKDEMPKIAEILGGIAAWPAGFSWAMVNSKPSPCKVSD